MLNESTQLKPKFPVHRPQAKVPKLKFRNRKISWISKAKVSKVKFPREISQASVVKPNFPSQSSLAKAPKLQSSSEVPETKILS